MLMAAVILIGAAFGLAGAAFCAPFWNALFSMIWSDPSESQRESIRSRLVEVHVRNGVPPDAAATLVAKEHRTTEERLLGTAQVLGAAGLRQFAAGKRSLFERVVFGFRNSLYRGSGR